MIRPPPRSTLFPSTTLFRSLTVDKVCNPATDPGKFNLRIDGAPAGTGSTAAYTAKLHAHLLILCNHPLNKKTGAGSHLTNYTSLNNRACAATAPITLTTGQH